MAKKATTATAPTTEENKEAVNPNLAAEVVAEVEKAENLQDLEKFSTEVPEVAAAVEKRKGEIEDAAEAAAKAAEEAQAAAKAKADAAAAKAADTPKATKVKGLQRSVVVGGRLYEKGMEIKKDHPQYEVLSHYL